MVTGLKSFLSFFLSAPGQHNVWPGLCWQRLLRETVSPSGLGVPHEGVTPSSNAGDSFHIQTHEGVRCVHTEGHRQKREGEKQIFFCDKGSVTPQAVSSVAEVLLAKTSSASNCSSSNLNEPKRSFALLILTSMFSLNPLAGWDIKTHKQSVITTSRKAKPLFFFKKKHTTNCRICANHTQPCTVKQAHTHTYAYKHSPDTTLGILERKLLTVRMETPPAFSSCIRVTMSSICGKPGGRVC